MLLSSQRKHTHTHTHTHTLMSSRELDSGFGRSSSLFGRLMEKRRTVKKFLLHRIIAVGRLSCGLEDRTDVAVHFERLKVRVQRSRPGEEVTGVLLLYPEHTLIVIECSTEALLCVLQDLRHSVLILNPRILLVTHDLHRRLFQHWNYTLWSENQSDGRRTIDSDDQTLVSETLSRVLRLGRLLLNTAEHMKGSKVIPDEVLQDVSDVIPPQAAVCRLVQMEALLSPERYMNRYHSPLHQPLDSECVWPALEHLQIV